MLITSRSIVLDMNMSIDIGNRFWQSLHEANNVEYEISLSGLPLGMKLPASLLYYNRNAINASEQRDKYLSLVSDLESSIERFCYSPELLEKIVANGIDLPRQTYIDHRFKGTSLVEESLNLIKQVWPPAHEEIRTFMNAAIVMANDDLQGKTSPFWFGTVFLGRRMLDHRNVRAIATSLIHETSHLMLFASCSFQTPLKDLNSDHFSSFRGEMRPAIMVLHAQIALARMILWLFNLKQYSSDPRKIEHLEALLFLPQMQKTIDRYCAKYLEGMDHVRGLDFTTAGLDLLHDFEAIEQILRRMYP